MTPEETQQLLKRLAQSEDPWVERKASFDTDEVRKTLVAFANSVQEGETAVLFIGARNDGRHPGVNDADDAQKKVSGVASKRCYPPIACRLSVLPVEVNGVSKEILVVQVAYFANRPHFAGPAYIRRGSESVEASEEVFKELIASQNSKARRILQFMDRKVRIRIRSSNGFWYEFDSWVTACDAHSATFRDEAGVHHAFGVEGLLVETTFVSSLKVTASAPDTEAEHLRTMLRRWYQWRPPPKAIDCELSIRDDTLDQLLSNPDVAFPVVSAELNDSKNSWVRLLYVQLRFAIRKRQSPMTPEQKAMALREGHQAILAKYSIRGWAVPPGPAYEEEVKLVASLATSVSEAFEMLRQVSPRNPRDVTEWQQKLLAQVLGLPILQ